MESEEILSGVPQKEHYSAYFIEKIERYQYFKNQFQKVVRNLVEQVNFQDETELLKQLQKRIENREKVSKRVKKLYPELSQRLKDYALNKKKELFLID